MTTRRTYTTETLSGTGKLYQDDKFLKDVYYSLQIKQEWLQGRSDHPAIEGMKEITGTVMSLDKDDLVGISMLSGDDLTLYLNPKDGRRFDCFVANSNGRIVARSSPNNGLYFAEDQ